MYIPRLLESINSKIMKIPFAELIPKNNIQKTGFFLAFVALVSLIFLHNPTSGYIFTYEPAYRYDGLFGDSRSPSQECHELGRSYMEYYKSRGELGIQEKLDAIGKKMRDTDCFGTHFVPFQELESKSPIVDWLGSVSRLFSLIVLVIVVAAVWILLFRSPS